MWVNDSVFITKKCRYRSRKFLLFLTLLKHRWVVVDVTEHDANSGGAGQSTHLTTHVFGLDENSVVFSGLSVHVC